MILQKLQFLYGWKNIIVICSTRSHVDLFSFPTVSIHLEENEHKQKFHSCKEQSRCPGPRNRAREKWPHQWRYWSFSNLKWRALGLGASGFHDKVHFRFVSQQSVQVQVLEIHGMLSGTCKCNFNVIIFFFEMKAVEGEKAYQRERETNLSKIPIP